VIAVLSVIGGFVLGAAVAAAIFLKIAREVRPFR